MTGARVDAERRQVAHAQAVARQRAQLLVEQALAVAAQAEHGGRRALLAQQQTLLRRVPGDALETLVASIREAQVEGLGVGQVEFAGLRVQFEDRQVALALVGQRDHAVFQHGHALRIGEALEGDTPQHFAAAAQLDQHRQLAGNGEQGAGERVVGQVRGFVVLQAGQRFALDAGAVSRQPDAGGAVGQRQVLFLQPQQGAVVPVHVAHHGGDAGGGDDQGEGEAAAAGEGHLRALGDFEPLRLRMASESSVKSARALRARGC